jgi:hypothetical protein
VLTPRQKHLIKAELRSRYAGIALGVAKGCLQVRRRNIPRVVFYPQLQLAYNRIGKSGNSSVLLYLHDAMQEAELTHGSPYNERKRLAMEAGTDLLNVCRDRETMQGLRDYVFFTVVRNPWTRTLSAFLDKVARGDSEKYKQAGGFGNDSPEGFSRFIAFLTNGGLHHDRHWWPQSDMLLLPPARYDHICRLEQLAEELPKALAHTGLLLPQPEQLARPHQLEASREGKITNASQRVKSYYTPSTIQTVARLYAADFRLGQYSLDPRSIGLS